MLKILGSARKLCGGVTRRDLLRVGGLGIAGLALPDILRLQAASASEGAAHAGSFGKAKNIILIHLYGSPSQMETFDPKPNAPLEVRGDLKSISSSLPGCDVCELLPNAAKVMDRCTVIRSMHHLFPLHGVAYALTGVPAITVPMELNPRDPAHWPYFGSVVDYLESRKTTTETRTVPLNMALPFRFSSRRVGEVPRAGPFAAFLGAEYDPVWTDFIGTATKGQRRTLRDMVFEDNDPFMGVSPDSYFQVPSATDLQPEITLDRLNRRRSLIEQLDQQRADLAGTASGKQFDRYRAMTYDLLKSDKLRTSLDTRREPAAMRASYGDTLFGHACLTARRLVEAGSKVVTVFWDEYGVAGSAWDTHFDHYPRMKNELCPGFDKAWHGLILDLEQRGLLDETLVVCTSEHGRTPKLSMSVSGGGRDHWSRAYSSVVAGAGICRGKVVGATDKQGGDVVSPPVSPKDLLATMYHLLGIDHHMLVHDALGRPLPLVEGKVVNDILA
ncbi:MAG TPA: DUF1501 domain-containing protein [Pirellulales bacterium]|jgi:hypothetical protein|nr:DUF1501 domain-containing protein [Pirellulales bacterium]